MRASLRGTGLLLTVFLLIVGCSGRGVASPTSPHLEQRVPEIQVARDSARSILAIGRINFDFEKRSVEFIPLRGAEKHWNVTPILNPPKCEDCVVLEVLEFDPAQKFVEVGITLTNPTKLTGYDVRGIVLTEDLGVRLVNADAYTALWDDGGPVKINPFRAFATDWADREFEGSGVDQRLYDFSFKQLPGLVSATLVVDASWPGHAEEAYDITNQEVSGGFTSESSSSVTISCVVNDWQSDVESVWLHLYALGYPSPVQMGGVGSVYSADISNQHSAPPGSYRIWIEARDTVAPERLADDLTVNVTAGAPPDFKLKPGETFVEASWGNLESAKLVTELHLYRREMGEEYDYDNPIVIPAPSWKYLDEDVLAGHLYFYRVSAIHSGAESERTEEHGAKPFKWGEVVLLSNVGGYSMMPTITRGLDDSVWAAWDFGTVENLDALHTPDWKVSDYIGLQESPKWPPIAVDADGYVYLCGRDWLDYHAIKYVKCDPYDGGVLINKYIQSDVSEPMSVQSSIDAEGTLHLVYIDDTPPLPPGQFIT